MWVHGVAGACLHNAITLLLVVVPHTHASVDLSHDRPNSRIHTAIIKHPRFPIADSHSRHFTQFISPTLPICTPPSPFLIPSLISPPIRPSLLQSLLQSLIPQKKPSSQSSTKRGRAIQPNVGHYATTGMPNRWHTSKGRDQHFFKRSNGSCTLHNGPYGKHTLTVQLKR